MVAREPAEGIRQVRIAARVVQGMPRFMEERLVVVQAALGAGDQVDDRWRIRRDHAGTRVLLGPVVEVELDPRVGGEVESESGQRLETDRHGAFTRVQLRER